MCRDNATPTHPDSEGNQFIGKTLTGWEETRQTLQVVEELRTQQENTDARVEVYEHSGDSSLKVSFRTLQELDDYLRSRFRRMLLKDESENASRQLEVMNEVVSGGVYIRVLLRSWRVKFELIMEEECPFPRLCSSDQASILFIQEG